MEPNVTPPGPAALDGPGPELEPHVRGMPLDGRPQELRRDDAALRHCLRRDQRRLRGVSRRRQPPCGLGSPGGRPLLEKLAALIPRPRTNLVVHHSVLVPPRNTPSVSAVLVEESPARVVGSPRGCSVHHRLGEQDDRPRRDLRNDHAGRPLRGLVDPVRQLEVTLVTPGNAPESPAVRSGIGEIPGHDREPLVDRVGGKVKALSRPREGVARRSP
jgi:hypothetical protein